MVLSFRRSMGDNVVKMRFFKQIPLTNLPYLYIIENANYLYIQLVYFYKREEKTMSFEQVKEIIVDTINCEEDKVTLDATLKDDIGIDSLDAMELSMALEEAFSLTIEEEALQKFETVKDIVEYIDSQTE